MDRETYIKYRNENSSIPLYEYYKENHKTGTLLDMGDFFKIIQMWPSSMEAFTKVLREYDIKFEVMTVSNVKTGQIIKYL